RGDGSVWCWGKNNHGQLGAPVVMSRVTPMAVPGLQATGIFLGGDFSCALLDGHYRCWGAGSSGQHGDGAFDDTTAPAAPWMMDRITTMAAGHGHACAVRDGNVACWGDGDLGELGYGTRDGSEFPVNTLPGGHAVAVSAGDDLSCAIRDDASVACWG